MIFSKSPLAPALGAEGKDVPAYSFKCWLGERFDCD
jgi:hypothetical protein